ncbi:hypothetical protein [Caballeronia sp. DA-9]|uniref:hypothetical protein n=1 Tax=Caballeronia sp. DA-9 TaxID=3436237 RepID=UPI003F67A0F6
MFSLVMLPVASSSPRKAASSPLRFPILSLDERKLTPALGYAFSTKWLDPCESLVSILWKFGQANGLPGYIVARQLSADADPYEGVAPLAESIDIRRVCDTLLMSPKALRASLFIGAPRRRYCTIFRYCRKCVMRGYHSVLHQLETEVVCPAHQRPLETACRRCGFEAQCVLSARFLETPFRCSYCRAGYSYNVFSILKRRPMDKSERVAITRRYFERYLT